jgi:hypothetical protein
MLTIKSSFETIKSSFETIKSSFENNTELYIINFSILLLYLSPYLFFSSFSVISMYKIYKNTKIHFDIKIENIDSGKNIINLQDKNILEKVE